MILLDKLEQKNSQEIAAGISTASGSSDNLGDKLLLQALDADQLSYETKLWD